MGAPHQVGAVPNMSVSGAGSGQATTFYPAYAAPGMVAAEPLNEVLVKQIEYYFSIENLCRDIFLRSKMDAEGFIPVATIAAFNRVSTHAIADSSKGRYSWWGFAGTDAHCRAPSHR